MKKRTTSKNNSKQTFNKDQLQNVINNTSRKFDVVYMHKDNIRHDTCNFDLNDTTTIKLGNEINRLFPHLKKSTDRDRFDDLLIVLHDPMNRLYYLQKENGFLIVENKKSNLDKIRRFLGEEKTKNVKVEKLSICDICFEENVSKYQCANCFKNTPCQKCKASIVDFNAKTYKCPFCRSHTSVYFM